MEAWHQPLRVRTEATDSRHHVSELVTRICLGNLPTRLNADNQRRAGLAFSVPPSQQREVLEY